MNNLREPSWPSPSRTGLGIFGGTMIPVPTAAPRPCRDRLCPEVAVNRRGWCALHDPGAFSGGRPMPRGWAQLRAAALRRDGGRCQLCGAPASEVDHVVPHAAGGSDNLGNLRSLCQPCHRHRTGVQAGQASAAIRR